MTKGNTFTREGIAFGFFSQNLLNYVIRAQCKLLSYAIYAFNDECRREQLEKAQTDDPVSCDLPF